MFEMMLVGFSEVLNFKALFLIVIGVIIGLIFGSVPGLTATMALALCLPITFGMTPIDGMAMLMGIYIGGVTGGLIPAILINIPGTPASIATTFDGYPMTKNGQGGKALGLGVMASFIGGLISIIVLIFIAPPVASLAIKFGPFEYFAIAVFSLTMIASLSGNSLGKGILSGLLGVGLASVGAAPIDGNIRFTFGFSSLDAGFNILVVMIGLFAVSEIIREAKSSLSLKDEKIETPTIKGFGFPLKELVAQKWNLLRSSAIGVGIGILPGIGGGTSNLLSYVAAKTQSKTPEKFGKGEPAGLVASETANNASIGGALVPLITLGIPGDTATAMLIGGLVLHGLTPGPTLFLDSGNVVYSIFASLLIANIVMLILFYAGIKWFIRVLKVPKYIMMPVILVLCAVGAYGLNNRVFDIASILFFGLLGYVLVKYKFPIVPVILGFILGPIAEINLLRGLMYSKGSFLPFVTEPISAAFLGAAVLSLLWTIWKGFKNNRRKSTLKDIAS